MPVHLENEAELVAQARAGDANAFATLMNQYARHIYRVTLNITGNHEDAEDAMQEAFLKAYSHLEGFQGASRFYTWLVRIAVNEAMMKLRQRRWHKEVSLDEPVELGEDDLLPREIEDWGENPERRYLQSELQTILAENIEALPLPFRTVFVLRDVEQFSTEEAAEVLGLSVAATKARLLRARLKLRQRLNAAFSKNMTAMA